MKKLITLCFFTTMLILGSCKQSVIEPVNEKYSFIDFKKGDWRQYNVDSIVYDDFTNRVDTFKYVIRIIVDSSWQPSANRQVYLAYAHQVLPDGSLFPYKTLQYELERNRLLTTDQNTQLINLVFPIKKNTNWWGNATTLHDERQQFVYKSVNDTFVIRGKQYFEGLTVEQIDDENFIFRNFAEEKYLPKVGLYKLENIQIETQNNRRNGLHYTLTLDTFAVSGVNLP